MGYPTTLFLVVINQLQGLTHRSHKFSSYQDTLMLTPSQALDSALFFFALVVAFVGCLVRLVLKVRRKNLDAKDSE